jgi:hypothetical protein
MIARSPKGADTLDHVDQFVDGAAVAVRAPDLRGTGGRGDMCR